MQEVWKGVLIEESLDETTILSELQIVGTRTTFLEKEASRGVFHFHNVLVEEEKLQKVIDFISSHLKGPTWYFHLVKGNEMVIIFLNKVFRIQKDHPQEIEKTRQFGLTQGIVAEQLPLEILFENPFG